MCNDLFCVEFYNKCFSYNYFCPKSNTFQDNRQKTEPPKKQKPSAQIARTFQDIIKDTAMKKSTQKKQFSASRNAPFPRLFIYSICQVIDYRLYFLFVGCVKISCISVNSIVDANRRMQLQYLDLTDCVIVQDGGLRIIVQNCPQLAYLYLRRCIQITGMYQSQIIHVPNFFRFFLTEEKCACGPS